MKQFPIKSAHRSRQDSQDLGNLLGLSIYSSMGEQTPFAPLKGRAAPALRISILQPCESCSLISREHFIDSARDPKRGWCSM